MVSRLVELVRRYCNRVDLRQRLAEALSSARQPDGYEPNASSLSVGGHVSGARRARVRDRLTDETVEILIAEFLAGTSKRELAERYAISFSSVKNLLRKHGVRRQLRLR
jgi:DNA invertase Pin-like site-specific DNA recombinase